MKKEVPQREQIQKPKINNKMRVHLILFVTFTILISCNTKNKPHNYTITSYKKMEEGYTYGKQFFNYKEVKYAPVLTEEYVNDKLTSVILFKSEGTLKYTIGDLNADTIFSNMLNIKKIREIEISNQIIKDNKKDYQISEIKNENVFCIRKDSLFIYKLK